MKETGYQQGILLATGCYTGDRYCVRNIDRWYCEAVSELFGTEIFRLNNKGRDQNVIKSARVSEPMLGDISDFPGFCRSWIEIRGIIDIVNRTCGSGKKRKELRLRIYGKEDALKLISNILPAGEKKIQYIKNKLVGGYTGETCMICYQSSSEIMDILDYIDGNPRNENVWEKWKDVVDMYRTLSSENI